MLNSTTPFNLTSTGYSSDGTTSNLSTNVTWTVTPASAGNVFVIGPQLTLSANFPTGTPTNLTVTAAYQGFSDTTNLNVLLPNNP